MNDTEADKGIMRSMGARARSRFFIPQCEPNASIEFIQTVARHSPTIAFNLWKVHRSKRLQEIRSSGIRAAYGIPRTTEIWLTSTAPDPWLENYYSAGIRQFKTDIDSFGPDRFEGPDLWMYREDGATRNTADWNRAMTYQEDCIDLPGFVPSMNGILAWHFTEFISRLEPYGFDFYMIPGREWLNHKKNWQRDQQTFHTLMDCAAAAAKGSIVVLGTSSPKKHKALGAADGFIGSGWCIQAGNRRLLRGQNWIRVDDWQVPCTRAQCCNGASCESLASKEFSHQRAIHNLLEIQEELAQTHLARKQQFMTLRAWS
jgi:hypothetical protein